MRLARSQRLTGTRRAPAGVGEPGAALQRHRRCSRRWPPVRLCWVGERSRSGGRASAATARSCGSSVARCARRRGVRRRCPGRCTVGRAARRGSRAPACGRWQGSIPVSDALWAQRLTPRREKFLKRHIPGLAGIHPGIRRSADPTTDRGQSYMALSRPRTTEPGSRDDHADPGRHLAPGATHLPGAAPVTAEIA